MPLLPSCVLPLLFMPNTLPLGQNCVATLLLMGSQEEEEEEDGRSATLMTRIEQCESPDNSSTSQQDAAMLYFTKHLARINNKDCMLNSQTLERDRLVSSIEECRGAIAYLEAEKAEAASNYVNRLQGQIKSLLAILSLSRHHIHGYYMLQYILFSSGHVTNLCKLSFFFSMLSPMATIMMMILLLLVIIRLWMMLV